jgi:hypothetical protein
MWLRLKMIDHILCAVKGRLQFFKYRLICPEKVKKGNRKYKQQSCYETYGQEDDLHVADQFFIVGELVSLDHIKHQEGDWNNTVIDAILKKRVLCGSKETEMPAEQNEGGNIPAHDKYADRHTHNGRADGIGIAKVFRCQ